MALRYRRMKREDVDTCVQFIATHPIIGPRYGKGISELSKAIKSVLHLNSVRSLVFEERCDDASNRIFAGGISGFVTDEFVQSAKRPPYYWIGPELVRLTLSAKTPFLSDAQLCAGNATHGLNEVVWFWAIGPNDVSRMEVRKFTMETHYSEMKGFRLKELLAQGTVVEEVESAIRSGGCLLGNDGQPIFNPDVPLEKIVRQPHILYMTKELMNKNFGSFTSMLFVYQEPRIGFSASEQRLLEEALRGGTEDELAMELEISISAVKKSWRSIYDRVERSKIGILPSSSTEIETPDRGRGKKHRLLAYVREHPEELRPISMKLLHQAQKGAKSVQPKDELSPTRRRVGRPRSVRP